MNAALRFGKFAAKAWHPEPIHHSETKYQDATIAKVNLTMVAFFPFFLVNRCYRRGGLIKADPRTLFLSNVDALLHTPLPPPPPHPPPPPQYRHNPPHIQQPA